MASICFSVFTRPMPVREAEYNVFYNEKHMPDVIRVPGFISGQRFHLVSNESHNRDIPPYLVVYDFKSYDLSATIAEIRRRAKTGITRTSSSFSPDAMVYSRRSVRACWRRRDVAESQSCLAAVNQPGRLRE